MGFTSNPEINHMFYFITSILAAAVFAFVTTRPGMRILNELCPKFFARCDDVFTLGLKDGLYQYDPEFTSDDEEVLQLETSLLLPLMYTSFGLALAASWIAALCGASTFGCLVLSFLASLLPFGFGLVLIVAASVMLTVNALFGAKIDTIGGDRYTADPVEPISLTDRALDYFDEKSEQLQEFKKNPRSLVDFLDDLYDAARAKLFNKRSRSTDVAVWKGDR